ncbi:MAG: flagellar protein FliT [Burkholderiales bacterium]
MDNDQIIAIYEDASDITRKMLAAARASDWDLLVEHEKACAARLAVLLSDQPIQSQNPVFQQRKGALIRAMLDDDTQIRMLVEPWLVKLTTLIGSARQQSRLHQSYNAM